MPSYLKTLYAIQMSELSPEPSIYLARTPSSEVLPVYREEGEQLDGNITPWKTVLSFSNKSI